MTPQMLSTAILDTAPSRSVVAQRVSPLYLQGNLGTVEAGGNLNFMSSRSVVASGTMFGGDGAPITGTLMVLALAPSELVAISPLEYLNVFDGVKMLQMHLDGVKTRNVH